MPYFDGRPSTPHWQNAPGIRGAGIGTSHGTFVVFEMEPQVELGADVDCVTLGIGLSCNLTATSVSQAHSSTYRLGVYTRSGSTLNLLNSASGTIGNTVASTANTSIYATGARMLTVGSSQWSSRPYFMAGERYFFAIQFVSAITTGGMSFLAAETGSSGYLGLIGTTGATNASNVPWGGAFRGQFNATTTAVPATIQASQVSGLTAAASALPFIRMDSEYFGA